MIKEYITILLVEDDEDDYTIIRETMDDIPNMRFGVDWKKGFEEALASIEHKRYDICIIDYLLGARTGVELMRELIMRGFEAPIIVLTGYGDHDIDMEAMREGARDYLEKSSLTPTQLERSIRYSIEQEKMIRALKVSENKLRALSVRILEAHEEERKLIAQELHDSIGSNLTAIKYALEQRLDQERAQTPQSNGIPLDQIIDMVRGTMEETRSISSNLRPSIIDDLGLAVAIRSLCREFQEVYRDVRMESTIEIQEENLPETLKIVIYRIVQEALNNVSKHSNSDRVEIRFTDTPNGIELFIHDNGRGFDSEHPHFNHGMGFKGMKERVELSNGSFDVSSEMGIGTTIRARWSFQGSKVIRGQ